MMKKHSRKWGALLGACALAGVGLYEMRCPFGALCHASGKALTPAQRERLCRWGDELIKAAPEQNFASSCRGRQMWPVALPVGQCVIAMESSEEPITEYKRWVRAFAVDPCGSPAPP